MSSRGLPIIQRSSRDAMMTGYSSSHCEHWHASCMVTAADRDVMRPKEIPKTIVTGVS